jgi:ribosomal protein S21
MPGVAGTNESIESALKRFKKWVEKGGRSVRDKSKRIL